LKHIFTRFYLASTALYSLTTENELLRNRSPGRFRIKEFVMTHHGHGLAEDIDKLMAQTTSRRQALRWLLAGAALPLVGTATPVRTPGATSASCSVIPEETRGPFPADGSNSNGNGIANALAMSGIVRSDIRRSFNGATGVAAGVPLTIRLELVNVSQRCAPAAGAAVYLWHCDRDGNYSMYSSGVTNQNYLRGVQEADSSGTVTFTTIYPGCYSGRVPHVHFEVFRRLAAPSASNRIKTSQFTFPVQTSRRAYAMTGYNNSKLNLANLSFTSDGVFSDDISLQLASITGDIVNGYIATLKVGIAP
jgi:protocatechuate 3,4-dioxygenase beta subunit